MSAGRLLDASLGRHGILCLGAEDVVSWSHHTGALDVLPGLAKRGVQILALDWRQARQSGGVDIGG